MRRDRRRAQESALLISTFRRIFGRPRRPSATRRSALMATLRLMLLLPFLLLIAIVSVWWLSAMRAALTGPGATFQFESLSFTLPRDKSLTIGRALLMQRPGNSSAETEHVRFEHSADGELRIANVAKERRLGIFRDQQGSNAGSADRIELTGPPGQTTRVVIDGRDVIFRNLTGWGFDVEIAGVGRFQTTIGLGWNRLRPIDAAGTAKDDLPVCAAPTWRDHVQSNAAGLAVLADRPLNQPVLYLGGKDTCQVGRAFTLALPRPDGIDELVVSMVTEGRFGEERRVFLAPVGGRARNLVTIERYPANCAPGDPRCRPSVQSGLSGSSWLVARPNAPATRELRVWRFVAGRTTYAIAVSPVEGASRSGAGPAMRVTLTPRSTIHQFSSADCGWFLAAEAAPPARSADGGEPVVCPERPQGADPAFDVKVTSTRGDTFMFDREISARSLDRMERLSRLAILGLAIAVSLLLATPAGSSTTWHWSVAWIRRVLQIWPVLVSVALAASPDILLALNVRTSASTGVALMIANWAFAGFVLALVPRTGRQLALMWVVLMGLAAIGSVSLATLAGDIGTTRAASFLVKHKLVFLDLLPPIVLAVVTARQEALRPLIASIVLDNRKRFAIVRWLPPIALISLFAFWLAIGTQQGLGGLQPVEGGKFWFVVMVGAILVSMERASRAEALSATGWSRVAAAFIVLLFMAAIYLVPFLRNDYSPLLIISATGLVLVLVRFLPDAWRWIVARFRVLSERMHLPMRVRPPVYEPFIPYLLPRVPRGAKFFAGIGFSITGLVGAALIFMFFGGVLLAFALSLERLEWPSDRAERITLLANSLGIGRQVPIERVLTWIDLDYDAVDSEGRPRANYRDIGFQVIRSRVEIENAECRMSGEMRGQVLPRLATLPNQAIEFMTLPNWAIERMAHAAGVFFGFDLADESPLCTSRALADETDTPTAATILNPRGAHTIPVAESDFAAAYLIARHGVASAVLLFAFQFAFFVLAVVSYVRLVRVEGGDTSDVIVRYLLSILLAATTALFVIQWFLAWSNSLGLFPVMGQPMTWLSSGTSHHLLMALPCAVTILLAIRYTVATPARRSLRAPPM